jgi:hypothetical protein
MARYKILTLVDITRSNPSRDDSDQLKLGQQSNFNSLIQTIGLRGNLEWDKDPTSIYGSLPYPLDGKARYWMWEFRTEREMLFHKEDNSVGLLQDDLHGVPIIGNLTNTTDFKIPVFQTLGTNQNIWIEII